MRRTAAASDQLLGDMLAVATSSRPRPRWLASFTQSPLRLDVEGSRRNRQRIGSRSSRLMLALLLVATVVVASILLRPVVAADGWPGFRGDASRVGQFRATGPIGQPILAWRYPGVGHRERGDRDRR